MIHSLATGTTTLLSDASGGSSLGNSYPRWGPSEGTVGWLAYSSRRPYGHTVTDGTAQIWVAAVDLVPDPLDPDPSFAPIWLAGQDPLVGNHTPIWVPRYTSEE